MNEKILSKLFYKGFINSIDPVTAQTQIMQLIVNYGLDCKSSGYAEAERRYAAAERAEASADDTYEKLQAVLKILLSDS
jgi:hypothetical protein